MKKYIFISPLLILFIWWLISAFKLVNAFYLPGPLETIREVFDLFAAGMIVPDIAATLERVILSFVIAAMIGLPLGLILGINRKFYKSFEFLIDFFRSIPPIAIFPLFVLIFGVSDQTKIAIAGFASCLIIIINTAHGLMHSKPSRILAAKMMGARKFQIFCSIMFWESLPQTLLGFKTAISFSLIYIVATEMFIGTNVGIGYRIIDFQYTYNVKGMYAMILTVGVIGYFGNFIFQFLENHYLHWTNK